MVGVGIQVPRMAIRIRVNRIPASYREDAVDLLLRLLTQRLILLSTGDINRTNKKGSLKPPFQNNQGKKLTLGKLRCPTGFPQTDFLTLNLSRVTSQQASFA